jgi:hypothetical protein
MVPKIGCECNKSLLPHTVRRRAPSGATTPLWYGHINPSLLIVVLALVANSWWLLREYRFRATCTPRKVEATLSPEVLGVHGKSGVIYLWNLHAVLNRICAHKPEDPTG